MKKFDENYKILNAMYEDEYFPDFLTDKLKAAIEDLISFLETGEKDLEKIQIKFDEMTVMINDLEEEFEQNDSELETVAREAIAETIEYILNWFEIDIDIEDALRERDW